MKSTRILLALALASIAGAAAAQQSPVPGRKCTPMIDCGVPGHGQNPRNHPKPPRPPKADKPQCLLPEGCHGPRGPRK